MNTAPEPTDKNMNGNGRAGLVASLADLLKATLTTLPPAFLMLVLMNVMFLGVVLWFVNAQTEQRIALASRVIETLEKVCLPKQ